MQTLISVIIPVYNRSDVVETCVESVRAQTYPNSEIILIDDGSTDGTLDVCRRIAAMEPRVVLLEMGHGGVSAARNRGLDAAEGEYIFFLDSDDVIHPRLLETLVRGMGDSGAQMGGTRCFNVSEKNWHRVKTLIEQDLGPGEVDVLEYKAVLEAVFSSNTPLNLIGGVMMRRDWIGGTRFREDLFIGEDFWFIYENLIKGADAVFLKQKWYYCRIHANNSSWNYTYDGFWTRFYRRELVWRSEETLGRQKYADLQKQQAFGIFLLCLKKNPPNGPDGCKMRVVIRKYRKTLFPALTLGGKVKYYLSVYTPGLYLSLVRIKESLK